MTRPGVRWRAIACGIAIVLGVTACTSNSADGPSTSSSGTTPSASVVDPSAGTSGPAVSSPPASPTPSVIDVPTPGSPTPTSLDPVAQEAADRAAIEAQWVKFWDIYVNLVRTPLSDRDALVATVSVEPTRTNLMKYLPQQVSTRKARTTTAMSRIDCLGLIRSMEAARRFWPIAKINLNSARSMSPLAKRGPSVSIEITSREFSKEGQTESGESKRSIT